jgi:hypothetical protein
LEYVVSFLQTLTFRIPTCPIFPALMATTAGPCLNLNSSSIWEL